MSAIFTVIALLLLAPPLRAEEQRVRIPEGCRELADPAGLPPMLTQAEATRALAYLRVMISRDPAAARCRLALRG